jgi:hypothetical protein
MNGMDGKRGRRGGGGRSLDRPPIGFGKLYECFDKREFGVNPTIIVKPFKMETIKNTLRKIRGSKPDNQDSTFAVAPPMIKTTPPSETENQRQAPTTPTAEIPTAARRESLK